MLQILKSTKNETGGSIYGVTLRVSSLFVTSRSRGSKIELAEIGVETFSFEKSMSNLGVQCTDGWEHRVLVRAASRARRTPQPDVLIQIISHMLHDFAQ